MRSYIYIPIIAALMVLQSCSADKNKSETVERKEQIPSSFKVATVLSAQPDFSITLPGELLPYEQVNIYPKIKGFIKKIYVDRGSKVDKGQLLAVLEAPEIGEEYSASQFSTSAAYQKYLFSKQSYNRLKEASNKSGAVATIELERAHAQLLGDSAAYKSSLAASSASGQINNYLRITAPFSGIITERFFSEGALVGESTGTSRPLFQLSQQNKLRLTVGIPEKEAESLPKGTKVNFTVVDFPGKIYTATLSRNSGAIDVTSRSVVAEFDVQNVTSELRAGQYAKIEILLRRPEPTLWVPSSGVVQAQSGVFVIKVEHNVTRRVPVE